MLLVTATLVVLSQFAHHGSGNPVVVARQTLTESEVGISVDFDTVEAIPLRRSTRDLQHSSRALRKKAANLNRIETDTTSAGAELNYQSGYALLRSTGASFLAPISIGSQSFLHVLDTGSADTWVAASDVQCLDLVTRRPVPQKQCYFGTTYTKESVYGQIANENFNITYGDGEFLTGTVGTADITLANIKVQNQTISLVDRAAWQGDGRSSGIIGLAYPALTAVFGGNDPTLDRYCLPGQPRDARTCNQIVYSSLTDNMFLKQRAARPVFALALSRDKSRKGDGGYMTIGGIPQLNQILFDKYRRTLYTASWGTDPNGWSKHTTIGSTTSTSTTSEDPSTRINTRTQSSIRASTRTSTRTSTPSTGNGGTYDGGRGHRGQNNGHHKGGWWQGWHRGDGGNNNNQNGRGSVRNMVDAELSERDIAAPPTLPSGIAADTSAGDYILDSGTTLSFIPQADAERFNNMFSPPGRYDRSSGYFMVNCTAAVPSLGVEIGGTTFWHNPKDLVKRYDTAGRICISGIQSSVALGGKINILGDVFMNSVLAVFDLQQGAIKFAARREYRS